LYMINRHRAAVLTLGLVVLLCTTCHAESPLDPLVKVKLARFFPPLLQDVTVTSQQAFTISDESGAVLVQAARSTMYTFARAVNGKITVTAPGQSADSEDSEAGGGFSGLILTVHGSPGSTISILSPDPGAIAHKYRGDIVVTAGLSIVNVVPLDDYIKGVLKPEIGADAPLEALKAQAVASRTYTISNLGKMSASGADMDDTTRTQSYVGADGETPQIDGAVDSTAGEVLTYNGQPIDAVFCTDCGGVTGDGGMSEPYLSPVSDPECVGNEPWQFHLSQAQALALLGNSAASGSAPVTVSVCGTDRSGRASMIIVSQGLSQRAMSGGQLRTALGYDQLRSTLFKITSADDGSYVINGVGWGHGLGMCQKGAIYLAQHSCLYGDILKHYYTGAVLTQLSTLMLVPAAANAITVSEPGPLTH
jgi:stage II sporulation protein D